MDSRVEKNQKSVVDQAMLRAFAKGQLDEVTEDKIVALLEERPELQAKVAAISTDDILLKMKAYSQNIAAMSQARQVGVDPSVDGQLPPNISGRHAKSMTPILDLPAELAALTDYKVICELGRGGMGVVYLAEHTITGRKEVLKVLNERLMTHQEARKRFEQEIKCTAALNHESIIRCYTVRTLPRTVVLAMEYVHGMDLQKFVATNGRLPIHLACGIASEVCLGLQHAMKEGLVHRDIKPSNIMLYKSDGKIKAKILDFGLARLVKSDQQFGLTQDGTLLGTLEYIAPEQCMNANKVDGRADIYSLGCTLYHMLVGHAPFSGSQGELILAHAQTIPSAVNLVRRDVPAELGEVVAKMLAKQPERRFSTPNDVAVALEPFLSRRITESTASKLSMIGAPETLGPAAEAQRDTSVEFDRNQFAENVAVPDATASNAASPSVVIVTSPKARARSPLLRKTSETGKETIRKWLSIGSGLLGALLLCLLVFGIIKIRTNPVGLQATSDFDKDSVASSIPITWTALFRDGIINTDITTHNHLNPRVPRLEVRDGLLVAKSHVGKTLFTKDSYEDFIIRIEYRVVSSEAAGTLMFRMPNAYSGNRPEGYLVGLYGQRVNRPQWFVYASGRSRDMDVLGDIHVSLNEWHTMEISCVESETRVSFDGETKYSFNDNRYRSGVFGLDLATPGIEIKTLEFREVELSPKIGDTRKEDGFHLTDTSFTKVENLFVSR